MQKDETIKFSGFVTVTVDDVDLEQIAIERPGLAHDQPQVKAFAAAQEKEGFKAIQRILMKNGQTLEPDDWKHGGGKYEVIFMPRAMLRDSEVAA